LIPRVPLLKILKDELLEKITLRVEKWVNDGFTLGFYDNSPVFVFLHTESEAASSWQWDNSWRLSARRTHTYFAH
jgi:hypothetical protein